MNCLVGRDRGHKALACHTPKAVYVAAHVYWWETHPEEQEVNS
jgi:hypothetical protein